VSRQDSTGTGGRGANVEGADEAVDACGGEDGGAVFVPVVGEGFGWGDLGLELGWKVGMLGLGRSVQGDGKDEVV